MKANELSEKDLMIGDWVMYNPNVFIEDEYESPKECYPTQIENGECLYWAIEGCYSPIPITPETLEKNFESESNIFGLQTYILNENFSLENRGDKFSLVRRCYDHYSSTFWICDLTYLHQLQHTLRLCGIEKEIIL